MLNKTKHQLILGQILKDIYTDISIAPLLGFKGGTCAYLFYHLPRFSVDLDFDLLSPAGNQQMLIFEKIKKILHKHGEVKDGHIKRNTLFLLLSYGEEDRNIKIEISTRKLMASTDTLYEIKEYLGIPMLAAKKDFLFANKLAALTSRKELAMRDVYDLYFFAKNNWDISAGVLENYTSKPLKKYLEECVRVIEKIKNYRVLQGLGELSDEKEKTWIRTNLKSETIFLLKNYVSTMG